MPALPTSRLFHIDGVAGSDDWYTPEWVFDGLGLTFDIDVAAPDGGVAWVPAKRHLTVAEDGLLTPWGDGIVWCNPPYSAPTLWCKKWAAHPGGGCILVRADLSTGGPFIATKAADAIWVPKRRLQFVNGRNGPTGAVNFSTVLLGRGAAAVGGMVRLAAKYDGVTRVLT